jgi:transposase
MPVSSRAHTGRESHGRGRLDLGHDVGPLVWHLDALPFARPVYNPVYRPISRPYDRPFALLSGNNHLCRREPRHHRIGRGPSRCWELEKVLMQILRRLTCLGWCVLLEEAV